MKRVLDFTLAFILIKLLCIPIFVIALLVKLTSRGPVFFTSERVGINNGIFKMYKFRTMKTDTPHVATHLLNDPKRFLTPIGSFLRKTSLDELPQLFNILKGQMSFIGPRPALFNQDDLIAIRAEKGIDKLVPGLTGWAQVNGRDELPIHVKAEYDEYYLRHRSFILDLKILWKTFVNVVKTEGISH